ncbi:MAG TPA: diguanylate cyclase [Candidatus Polarisedimenticolia bacterium]|nr:diguanylate cyclase [Candidatus Polarisedimenticolia bacterium]
MQIRTKLLLALMVISLFPPIAAFVALIGNPRISFSLRMNEYEAEQGLTAQRLQSDLYAVLLAAEESLGESYRMQLDPREREDAERQRQLANAALRSELAAYETDLDTITRSEKQQVQEIVAAGKAKGLGAGDQRETELLKMLGESLPSIKSMAEKFIQLSDASSQTEGEFLQKVFEPEARGEVAKATQELASGTNQASEENRHNIEKALKAAYEQTILIVLLGVAATFVLAAVISRSVIGPIQKLRDAALQFGQGHMDTRIPVHSNDELGELAASFNVMADNLTKLMWERRHAQDELSKANEGLKNSIGELESRNREAGTLSEMADLLHSCFTLEEASGVIASSARKLFPGFSGAVVVFSASRNVLEAIATWGRISSAEKVFSPNECWALRRGHLHHSTSDEGAVRCAHFGTESRLPSLCTPLMAHGETLGILCLVTEPTGLVGTVVSISEFNVRLAVSMAEHAALSFANLKLREKLRHQSIRDPLTGLFNRRFLDESLERELSNAVRTKRSLGVVMLDVDRFKRFNDTFGHDAGDTVLRELGDHLAKFIRRGDLACRYGGEEFTLILPDSSLEDTRRRAEELRISFQQISIKHNDIVLGKVTLSLGVAALPENGTTAIELLAAADGALFKAKEEGRDRVLIAEVSPTHSE